MFELLLKNHKFLRKKTVYDLSDVVNAEKYRKRCEILNEQKHYPTLLQ